ncbi:MAG TPA: hypothetical protein VJ972_00060 [Anaerolineales bacterium]|nr:hypothetical protein [Anaerolineales bacterium]
MAKLTKRSHTHPKLRITLYSILLLCGGLLLGSVLWFFQRIQSSLGSEVAEVSVSLLSILILALILVGVRAGWNLDRFIRQRKIDIWMIHRSFRKAEHFLSLLGYEEVQPKSGVPDTAIKPNMEQALALIEKPKRRGRPPAHSLDRWTRVVLAWENRDLYRKPITLTEFLSEEFGTYADGSPCMSENSFYENRKKVFDELRKSVTLNQEITS